jgi:hypothetical protein
MHLANHMASEKVHTPGIGPICANCELTVDEARDESFHPNCDR